MFVVVLLFEKFVRPSLINIMAKDNGMGSVLLVGGHGLMSVICGYVLWLILQREMFNLGECQSSESILTYRKLYNILDLVSGYRFPLSLHLSPQVIPVY